MKTSPCLEEKSAHAGESAHDGESAYEGKNAGEHCPNQVAGQPSQVGRLALLLASRVASLTATKAGTRFRQSIFCPPVPGRPDLALPWALSCSPTDQSCHNGELLPWYGWGQAPREDKSQHRVHSLQNRNTSAQYWFSTSKQAIPVPSPGSLRWEIRIAVVE